MVLEDFRFSSWVRLWGAATCALMAFTAFDGAAKAGILDFSNDVHWRARAAAMFWAACVGGLLSPPSGVIAGFVAMLVGAAVSLTTGAAELTVWYVLKGFSLPSFYWAKVTFFVFIPAAFGFIVPAFIRSPSSRSENRSTLERLASHPILSLFFGACTVVGTAATIWPELGSRIHSWF